MMLVVGAGLMTRSFLELLRVDPGFRPDHLVAVNFTISTTRHQAYAQFYRDVIEEVRRIPGIVSAAAVKDAPFRGNGERNGFLPPGMVVRRVRKRRPRPSCTSATATSTPSALAW